APRRTNAFAIGPRGNDDPFAGLQHFGRLADRFEWACLRARPVIVGVVCRVIDVVGFREGELFLSTDELRAVGKAGTPGSGVLCASGESLADHRRAQTGGHAGECRTFYETAPVYRPAIVSGSAFYRVFDTAYGLH